MVAMSGVASPDTRRASVAPEVWFSAICTRRACEAPTRAERAAASRPLQTNATARTNNPEDVLIISLQFLDGAGRHAHGQGIGRDILGDHRPGAGARAVANGDGRHQHGVAADKGVLADDG